MATRLAFTPVAFTSIVALVIVTLTLGVTARSGRSSRPGAGDPRAAAAQAGQPGSAPQAQPTPPCGPNLALKNVDKQSRCFELRTYTVREGSSIDLLHSRFREHTTALFQKHGMTVVGYWQPLAKPDALVYLLAYKDAAARDASWAAFQADPEWIKVRAAPQINVQIESAFMIATDYSPMK